jgi:hypothetical protein
MVRQPEFASAQFHTAYLDELLHSRAGRPFFTPDASIEEVAAIAVEGDIVTSPAAVTFCSLCRHEGRPAGPGIRHADPSHLIVDRDHPVATFGAHLDSMQAIAGAELHAQCRSASRRAC